jgi:hypothetical protein
VFESSHRETQQVVKNRGDHCGDIELVVYLVNGTGPVSLVLDLHITHDRYGSNSDPNLNGRLLFLQTHRETDHFYTVSGVQLA